MREEIVFDAKWLCEILKSKNKGQISLKMEKIRDENIWYASLKIEKKIESEFVLK